MSKRGMSQVIQAKVTFIEERNIQKLDILKDGNNCQKLKDNFETTWDNFKKTLNTLRQLGDNFKKTLRQLLDNLGTTLEPYGATKWLSTELTSAQ